MTEHEKMQREKCALISRQTESIRRRMPKQRTTAHVAMFVSAGAITFRKRGTSRLVQSMSIPTSLTVSMLQTITVTVLTLTIIPFYGISQSCKYKRAIRFFEHLIALYFYNNSNYVAILLPRSIYNRQKPSRIRLFHGCEIIPTRQSLINFAQRLFSVVFVALLII